MTAVDAFTVPHAFHAERHGQPSSTASQVQSMKAWSDGTTSVLNFSTIILVLTWSPTVILSAADAAVWRHHEHAIQPDDAWDVHSKP